MRQHALEVTVLFAASLLALLCLPQSLEAQAAAQSHLYFFTSDGCAPCRHVEPAIESLHREGFPVSTVNVNRQSELANRFLIDRTPTVILVTGDRITGRHAGQIDLPTLRQWFAAVGQKPNARSAVASPPARVTPGTKVAVSEAGTRSSNSFTSPTMHQGTTRPANRIEAQAMAATVRLKVEDPEGISYATGTVIHSRPGEALVLTCGHVFREAQGKGVITAEYGFDQESLKTAPGQLIHYDAKAHDIGLVAIQTQGTLIPVDVAPSGATVAVGDRSFSIGCDHGEPPTIRHTAVKNLAKYDGEIKYDIFGRPVDGRSGGGLFTESGQLIGVCNAAAVEVDEGIYSGIDTIHWQFAQTNLTNLFSPASAVASKTSPEADRFASLNSFNRSQAQQPTQSQREFALAMAGPVAGPMAGPMAGQRSSSPRKRIAPRQQLVAGSGLGRPATSQANFQRQPSASVQSRSNSRPDSDMEVIILVRSKTDPSVTETITVANPSEKLLDHLSSMRSSGKTPRQLDIAQMRKRPESPADTVYSGKWR